MKYMTAGELRGASLVAIVDDVPAGLRLQAASIQADLDRWSHGCSCGERREVDCAAILSGVSADGRTTGSPLSLVVDNASYRASLEDEAPGQAAVPRPGSADLAGLLATDANDCRSIVEGSSARSQAALIAASAVAREFLAEFGVEIQSYVTRIGAAAMREQPIDFETLRYTPLEIESSPVRCPSAQASRAMEEEIAAARAVGDTLGGEAAVAIHGVAPALGSYRGGGMMARLSKAAFSVNDVVSVSFGSACDVTRRRGSAAYDSAVLGAHGFAHATNISRAALLRERLWSCAWAWLRALLFARPKRASILRRFPMLKALPPHTRLVWWAALRWRSKRKSRLCWRVRIKNALVGRRCPISIRHMMPICVV